MKSKDFKLILEKLVECDKDELNYLKGALDVLAIERGA